MTAFDDMFKPYSPELRGDLEAYLRERDRYNTDNFFFGPKYFFVMKEKGLLLPKITCVRVGQSPAPDIAYFVNKDFLLESRGFGHKNMSLMGAKEGVYDPKKALRGLGWSAHCLNLYKTPFSL